MSVYVDQLQQTTPSLRWPYHQTCHLVADSLNELHLMAARLGLRKRWFQNQASLPHYDLTSNKRALAIRLGAREISWQQLKEIIKAGADSESAAAAVASPGK